MRTLLTILVLTISVNLCGQIKMKEQRAMKESHIDFTKEYIYFTIHGLIEIDGHIFKNDTCKCPIQFQANLEGITIIDTCLNMKYEYRKCEKVNCPIVHLVKKEPPQNNLIIPGWNYKFNENDLYFP